MAADATPAASRGAKRPGVRTPQFRTLLLRRLGNLYPDYSARIEEAARGITFQLFGRDGRPRTGRINLYRSNAGTLTRRGLLRQVERSKPHLSAAEQPR